MKVESPVSHRLVEAVTVDFIDSTEPWATFKLEDGSVIKLRATPTTILRLEGEFDAGGNPVYVVQLGVTSRTVKSVIRGQPTTPQPDTKPAPKSMEVG